MNCLKSLPMEPAGSKGQRQRPKRLLDILLAQSLDLPLVSHGQEPDEGCETLAD